MGFRIFLKTMRKGDKMYLVNRQENHFGDKSHSQKCWVHIFFGIKEVVERLQDKEV